MLNIWVIYDHPDDFPDQFTARRWVLDRPTDEYLFADTLDELRGKLPPGLVRLQRDPADDPKIVESWL